MTNHNAAQVNLEHNKATALGQLPPSHYVHRVLAQRDLVVTHATVRNHGIPAAVAFDLWRLAEGRVVEHWSDQEPWVAQTANGHSQVDGVTSIDPAANTDATQKVVEATVRTILIANDFSSLNSYLAGEDYIQHNPRFADGISGLAAALKELADKGITMKYTELVHSVAEGDFAYAYSFGQFGGVSFVFHDLFRVANGRATEHWDVMVPR
jgi:predicted SnoaL-like aldol condensation-catalyzing enzyme